MSEYDQLSCFDVGKLIRAYAEGIMEFPFGLSAHTLDVLGKLMIRKNELIELEKKQRIEKVA